MTDFAARLLALADELSDKLDSEFEDRQLMAEHAERTIRQIAVASTESDPTAAFAAELDAIANEMDDFAAHLPVRLLSGPRAQAAAWRDRIVNLVHPNCTCPPPGERRSVGWADIGCPIHGIHGLVWEGRAR
jgi:hypothetical protein